MEHSISILFYQRVSIKTTCKLMPIYMRITINGQRIDQTTSRFIEPSKWSARSGTIKGTASEAKALSNYLDTLKNKVHKAEREMVQDGIEVTYQSFKDKWVGASVKKHMVPVLSNQKMNSYLKEIADTCGIEKNLTFHAARHTFATTVTLSNRVPIETVSKMLGHTSIKTTQHYAKIVDLKISEDMNLLRKKMDEKSRIPD